MFLLSVLTNPYMRGPPTSEGGIKNVPGITLKTTEVAESL